MFIELNLLDDNTMLVPVSSITTVIQETDYDGTVKFCLVYLRGLELHASRNNEPRYQGQPDPLATETVEVTNDYTALKFLLQAQPKDKDA